jgi:hypothetical protein
MSNRSLSIALVFTITALVVGYAAFLIHASWPLDFGNVDKAGVFGDSFGVLTSLFSGLAFAGIIFTILLQRDELQLQRRELELTRGEIKNQNQTIEKQNFENTLFQMLRLHNDIVNTIDLRRDSQRGQIVTRGRDCFVAFYKRIQECYPNVEINAPDAQEEEKIQRAYELFWSKNQQELSHYFRYLYTIFKFIKFSDVGDKRLYSNIVRAQLSDQELLVLFYNCLSKYGKGKFKPIAEEFALFNNLPITQLLKDGHQEFFSASAYGGNAA